MKYIVKFLSIIIVCIISYNKKLKDYNNKKVTLKKSKRCDINSW